MLLPVLLASFLLSVASSPETQGSCSPPDKPCRNGYECLLEESRTSGKCIDIKRDVKSSRHNSAKQQGHDSSQISAELEEVERDRFQRSVTNPPSQSSSFSQDISVNRPPKDNKSSTRPSIILLWIVVACGAVLAISLPAIFICALMRLRRLRKEHQSAKTTVYTGDGTAPAEIAPSDQEAILQTYRRQRQQQESNQTSNPQPQVIRQSSASQEPVHGHMDIYTGHRVLSFLDDHIEHPDRLDKEWEALVGYEADGESKSDGLEEHNKEKNRYPDVLPYNRNRVHLDSAVNPSRRDYINASFICDRSPQPIYIATQGPLENTVSDFWQMVWEQGCSVIVNLTQIVDQGIPQCHQYWPNTGKTTYHMYEVDFVSSHPVSSHYTIRSFFLKNLKTEATRTVTQCHFHSWPSLSVPDDTPPILEFRRKVKKTYSDASKPIIVHDSAGIGRTGTYILIDMVLNRLSSASVREIDIAATVEVLRDQRMQMVKTEAQFKFAFRALVDEVRAILDAMPGQNKH